ncbi:MAG TPA: archaellin/type IV pilin N-terminal domain-containing protein, partial [Candidatus Nanoarchaeia archaeon]|nr:archaellin/type IV pilin N-terminal domain-containing protein [Candidatus Nanoarchaeia archaeon]
MMHNNKGISPLIATVLIIGFTVALAAIIMTWGRGFIDSTTKDVDKQRETALLCTSQLDFKFSKVDCVAGK